ncbi:hypothetical protein M513_08887 [Trichuris suis]|uniref:Uncharacterized protein n=1 Tax=Trichuris suis TaxID=68888 RepID=A0A085LZ63_9BILA|nr:hypothetical protein M513_10813 [Trichuris suis]KFD50259.1 hypothetical protein M513_08887 [Trichuris suis]
MEMNRQASAMNWASWTNSRKSTSMNRWRWTKRVDPNKLKELNGGKLTKSKRPSTAGNDSESRPG